MYIVSDVALCMVCVRGRVGWTCIVIFVKTGFKLVEFGCCSMLLWHLYMVNVAFICGVKCIIIAHFGDNSCIQYRYIM
jgi:hypothetical protein